MENQEIENEALEALREMREKPKRKRKPKPVNPYDYTNTTPAHNFEPFMKGGENVQ